MISRRKGKALLKNQHQIKKRKKVFLFSSMERSISLESAITSWEHCRSSIPWTDHLESKFVMWCPYSTLWQQVLEFINLNPRRNFMRLLITFYFYKTSFYLTPCESLFLKFHLGWFKLSRKTFSFFFFLTIWGWNMLLENLPALIWSYQVMEKPVTSTDRLSSVIDENLQLISSVNI